MSTIRAFTEADVSAIQAIQGSSPQASQWRAVDYVDLAAKSNGFVLVAEKAGEGTAVVVGFAAFQRILDEAELRNIAVHPLHRRSGIAAELLGAGIQMLQEAGVRQLFLEVRASNDPALAFYRGAGFQWLYTRRHYYRDPEEDALAMGIDIGR